VNLLDRNGVGHRPACKAIRALLPAQDSIAYRGRRILCLRADAIAHLRHVPQDRQIFPTRTVRRPLERGLKRPGRCERCTFADMSDRLPLRERRRSGCGWRPAKCSPLRTLVGDPDLIIIGEPGAHSFAPSLASCVAGLA
jgi:ABC-type branched-subunit amino acid transport system ATPase component